MIYTKSVEANEEKKVKACCVLDHEKLQQVEGLINRFDKLLRRCRKAEGKRTEIEY